VVPIVTKLRVRVAVFQPDTTHHQLLAGFFMLARDGVIDLDVRFENDVPAAHPSPTIMEAMIANGVTIAYDLEDGYIIDWPSRDRYLQRIDLCFKRSYCADHHASSPNAEKFRPLGLVYDVTMRHPSLRRHRPGLLPSATSTMKRLLGREVVPYWWRFEDVPRYAERPSVLFSARLWDPEGEKGECIGDRQLARADREPLNEMRVECIRRLRKELGPAFVGGLVPTRYARERFPDCIVSTALTKKASFLKLIHQSDVCVATRGLFGSNGFKLGEYVAASRAVVSERLVYSVPDGFEEKRNYLAFDTPDQCVEQVMALVADPDRSYAMQVSNYSYYHRFVRPDRMVLNTLLEALHETGRSERLRAVASQSTAMHDCP
jgi:hypothetical protein